MLRLCLVPVMRRGDKRNTKDRDYRHTHPPAASRLTNRFRLPRNVGKEVAPSGIFGGKIWLILRWFNSTSLLLESNANRILSELQKIQGDISPPTGNSRAQKKHQIAGNVWPTSRACGGCPQMLSLPENQTGGVGNAWCPQFGH